MKLLEKQLRVTVRSHTSSKEIIRPVSAYVDGKLYSSFEEYLFSMEREHKKYGYTLTTEEIMNNEEVFSDYINRFVNPLYTIDYEDRHQSIWVLKTFKKATPIFLFLETNVPKKAKVETLNDILLTYGFVHGKPKYEAKALKPRFNETALTSNNSKKIKRIQLLRPENS